MCLTSSLKPWPYKQRASQVNPISARRCFGSKLPGVVLPMTTPSDNRRTAYDCRPGPCRDWPITRRMSSPVSGLRTSFHCQTSGSDADGSSPGASSRWMAATRTSLPTSSGAGGISAIASVNGAPPPSPDADKPPAPQVGGVLGSEPATWLRFNTTPTCRSLFQVLRARITLVSPGQSQKTPPGDVAANRSRTSLEKSSTSLPNRYGAEEDSDR